MAGFGQVRHHFIEFEPCIGRLGEIHGVGNAGRKGIVGLGDGNADRRRAEGAPEFCMKRALNDPDSLALKLLGPRYRLLGQQMAGTVVDEVGDDEILREQFLLEIGADLAIDRLADMIGIAKQKRQVEQLQLRCPAGKRRHRREACLDRAEPDTFGDFLFPAECAALDDVEAELAG
ncbi:hypothetical protein D9M72_566670 [compost metagenome]